MVKIRLRRVGSKKQASFRVVAADSRSPRDGRFIEQIGFYNPRTEPETLRIDEERALYWLSVGAQPTDSAARLLRTTGTMGRFARLKEGEPLEDLLTEAEEALRAEVEEPEIEEEAAEADVEEAPEADVEEEPEADEPVEGEMEEAAEPVEETGEAGLEEPVEEEPETDHPVAEAGESEEKEE